MMLFDNSKVAYAFKMWLGVVLPFSIVISMIVRVGYSYIVM